MLQVLHGDSDRRAISIYFLSALVAGWEAFGTDIY